MRLESLIAPTAFAGFQPNYTQRQLATQMYFRAVGRMFG